MRGEVSEWVKATFGPGEGSAALQAIRDQKRLSMRLDRFWDWIPGGRPRAVAVFPKAQIRALRK